MPAPAEGDPQPRQHRRERDDEERVHRLQHPGGDGEPEDVQVGVAVGEQVERGALLLVAGEEHHRAGKQRHHHPGALALDRGRPAKKMR